MVESPRAEQGEAASRRIGQILQHHIPTRSDVDIMGPAEAPITRLHDRYRWHLLIKSASSRALHQCLTAGLKEAHRQKAVSRFTRVSVDIDPLSFL